MPTGLVLMAAIPPTWGHAYLIDFATEFMAAQDGRLVIAVCCRKSDPIPPMVRHTAIRHYVESRHPKRAQDVEVLWWDEDAQPSKAKAPHQFWEWWNEQCNSMIAQGGRFHDNSGDHFVIASDLYGADLAKALGWEFVPCNTYREVVRVSGTAVRQDPFTNFGMILPDVQRYLTRTITIFGPESCGKTTMARRLAETMNGHFVPEWAREYMEVLKTNVVTDDLMDRITLAQTAAQLAVQRQPAKPFIFQDTDLLSTVGYYKLYGGSNIKARNFFAKKPIRSDHYIVMNDQIPFTPDFLRLGGTKRESDVKFWTDLLEAFGQPYTVVRSTYRDEQEAEIRAIVTDIFMRRAGFVYTREC